MTRRLTVWAVGLIVVLASVVLVGCTVSLTSVGTIAAPPAHKPFPAGTACDASGCHPSPHVAPSPFVGPCETCHDTVSWNNVKYSHKDTSFDNGMHPVLGCTTCHTAENPMPTGGCAASACHARKSPHGGWADCGKCHTTLAWGLRKPIPTNHLSLAGGHSTLTCFQCHTKPVEPAVARTCVDCHGPHHGGLRNCQDCHDPGRGWKPKPGFNHNQFFQLVGAHRSLQCAQCHKNGVFAGTPRFCSGCHGSKHGGLTDCGRCHTTSSFEPSTFSHSSVFRLTGAHTRLACSRCHPGGVFARVAGTACVDCHGPHHGGLKACASCHTTTSFKPSTFKHSKVFALTGAHASLACTKCHAGGAFAKVKGTHCVDCHGVKHGNQTQCQNCHTTTNFTTPKPVIAHPAPVPLGTFHSNTTRCNFCHPGLIFNAPTTTCVTCHAADVPHVGPSNCIQCHWPTTWSDTHFTHAAIPGGVHTSTSFGGYPTGCTISCHPGPNFNTYSCSACH